MATQFELIRNLIRPLIDDTDNTSYSYENDTLNGHIKAAFLIVDDSLTFTADSFDQELNFRTQLLIALEVALSIWSIYIKDFSHKSPILNVSRKWDTGNAISRITAMKKKIEGSRHLFASRNEYNLFLNLNQIHFETIEEAILN